MLPLVEAVVARPCTFPRSTPEIKRAELERCIYPSLTHQMKLAAWSLAKYRKLDKKANGLVKKLTSPSRLPQGHWRLPHTAAA